MFCCQNPSSRDYQVKSIISGSVSFSHSNFQIRYSPPKQNFAHYGCMLYRQMPSNIQLNCIIRFFRAKHKDKVQDCKDKSGLQFIKFDFVTGGQGIKLAILVKFWLFYLEFCLFCWYFLLPSLLAIVSSYFKIIKWA